MLNVQALNALGVNTQEGLSRCMNNEAFYLKLVNMALDNGGYAQLTAAVRAGDKHAAFEAAHALKGMVGNLSLTPLYEPVSEMTELLRAGSEADYESLLQKMLDSLEALKALR